MRSEDICYRRIKGNRPLVQLMVVYTLQAQEWLDRPAAYDFDLNVSVATVSARPYLLFRDGEV